MLAWPTIMMLEASGEDFHVGEVPKLVAETVVSCEYDAKNNAFFEGAGHILILGSPGAA